MKLYLVRHPKPVVEHGICYGASDLVCHPAALEATATALKNLLPNDLTILSSPLSRCEQLAQHLCRLEPSFPYKSDARLAEMNFGNWELKAWDAIAAHELAAWTQTFAAYRCGGTGESAGHFVQRVAKRLYESAQDANDQIWITHAGVIRALGWLAGQPAQVFTALAGLLGRPFDWDDGPHCRLYAADWPAGAIAFGQVHLWHWPPAWPQPTELPRV